MRVRCKPVSNFQPLQLPKFGFDGFLLALQSRLRSFYGRQEQVTVSYGIDQGRKQRADYGAAKTSVKQVLDLKHTTLILVRVNAVTRRSPLRLKQVLLFVIAQGPDADASPRG